MTARLLEVCVDGPDGLAAAVAGGADRIELCAALELGGLTPSPGLMALAAGCGRPVMAMIRPRGGDFIFGAAELDLMIRDIDAVRAAGLTGVVIGASRPGGALDEAALTRLTVAASGLDVTLHRAIDLVPDVAEAVEVAVGLGIRRILTSGGKRSALAGIGTLRRTLDAAAGRLTVMAGAGLSTETVGDLLSALPDLVELHASCSLPLPPDDPPAAALGFTVPRRIATAASVAALKHVIRLDRAK